MSSKSRGREEGKGHLYRLHLLNRMLCRVFRLELHNAVTLGASRLSIFRDGRVDNRIALVVEGVLQRPPVRVKRKILHEATGADKIGTKLF